MARDERAACEIDELMSLGDSVAFRLLELALVLGLMFVLELFRWVNASACSECLRGDEKAPTPAWARYWRSRRRGALIGNFMLR